MKVIFLDIDGVLNSMDFMKQQENGNEGNLGFLDERAVVHLKDIVDATQAQIVLSSSWRSMFDEQMQPLYEAANNLLQVLAKNQLTLIGKTKQLQGQRGAEVRAWLAEHQEVKNFVILDDAPFADWNELTNNWVQTDFRKGLTDQDVTKAIMILQK